MENKGNIHLVGQTEVDAFGKARERAFLYRGNSKAERKKREEEASILWRKLTEEEKDLFRDT